MHIIIGVIGPEETVNRIFKVSEEFEEIEFIPFVYSELSQIAEIIKKNNLFVDQWLFSGIMNYSFAMDKKIIQSHQGTYLQLHGSSFFGVLMEAQLNEKQIFRNISIDTITEGEISKILSFYNLGSLNYFSAPYNGYDKLSDMVVFHKTLFKEKQTQLAITSIKSTYEKLKKEGVLVYRLTPSYLAIKLTIELLVKKAQATRFASMQMAIIGCRMVNKLVDNNEMHELFKWKHHELDLKKSLLELTQRMNGSFVDLGDGLYFIFTTKGEIDYGSENELFRLMNEYLIQKTLSLSVAIGYGETVTQAEQNVRYGLSKFHNESVLSLQIIDGDYSVITKTPNRENTLLSSEYIKEQIISRFGEDATNSWRDVIRIAIYSRKHSKEQFTSQDVSRWLYSTERNARRILAELESDGILRKNGHIRLKQRGRPKNVYEFIGDFIHPQKSNNL